jgi:hypothetical protein
VKKIALANPLKAHCDDFLRQKLGISAFTQNSEEKLLIRPFLVWYGDAKRKQTGGKFWTDLASNEIETTNYDYYIITDVRYDFYEQDELYWLKTRWEGKLCHVRRWETKLTDNNLFDRQFVQPANDHEATNDPKIWKGADYRVEWEHIPLKTPEELFTHTELNKHVDAFLATCKIIQ